MGRLKALEQSCLSAVDVTQERLLTLLKENAETEFGKKHEFSEMEGGRTEETLTFQGFENRIVPETGNVYAHREDLWKEAEKI